MGPVAPPTGSPATDRGTALAAPSHNSRREFDAVEMVLTSWTLVVTSLRDTQHGLSVAIGTNRARGRAIVGGRDGRLTAAG